MTARSMCHHQLSSAYALRPGDGLDDNGRSLGTSRNEDSYGLVEIGYVERANGITARFSGVECRGERLDRHS